jgi:hypothetical protein
VKLLRNSPATPWAVLAISLAFSLGVWRWAEYVLAPAYGKKILSSSRPVGNNSDLYPRWLGTRELLLHGRDPYSPEMTREMQAGFYGRPLDPNNPSDPAAREAFTYPLYVAFLLAPTATLPFSTVVQIFRVLMLASIACSVPLWMYALGLRPKWPWVFSGMLLAVGSFPAVEEYFQQNLTALAVLFLAGAAAAAAKNWLALSGFLLALATIKPDTTGLLMLWFLLWAGSRWTKRRSLIFSFSPTMLVLVAAAEAKLPGWIGKFFQGLREYSSHDTDPSILSVLFTPAFGKLVAILLIGCLVVVCWRQRNAPPGSVGFGWSLACVAAVTLALLPKLAAYNQLLLVPALLMMVSQRNKSYGRLQRALVRAALACQLWQWCAASVIAAISLFVTAPRLWTAAEAPLYTLLALSLLTVFAVLPVGLSLRSADSSG